MPATARFDVRVDAALTNANDAAHPLAVTAPFSLWRVTLIGDVAATGSIAPHVVDLGSSPSDSSARVRIETTPVDVSVGAGESRSFAFVAPPAGGLPASISFNGAPPRAVAIEGPGRYRASADGLTVAPAPAIGGAPIARCWVSASTGPARLLCQPVLDGLPPRRIHVEARSGGVSSSVTAYVGDERTSVVDRLAFDVAELRSGAPFVARELGPADFPLDVKVEIEAGGALGGVGSRLEGMVVGLGAKDPFIDAPITSEVRIDDPSAASEDAPLTIGARFTCGGSRSRRPLAFTAPGRSIPTRSRSSGPGRTTLPARRCPSWVRRSPPSPTRRS
jgi:hypothetical protein